MDETTKIRSQPGPQHAFATTAADIAIYGGQVGGGKTFGLILETMRHLGVPGFSAVVFRRTSPQLTGGGSIWEEARPLYRGIGCSVRESPVLDVRSPAGAIVEFRHLQHESDAEDHQGKQYAAILWDELTHFTSRQFWYLLSRNRSTCGKRPYVRATCNPDPDSFVAALIAWWIDADGYPISDRAGVLRYFVRVDDDLRWADSAAELREEFPGAGDPQSLTFIPARLEDNPALESKDPAYRSRIASLPRIDRLRLGGGNWKVRASAGMFFQRSWFTIVDDAPVGVTKIVRAWDKAATKPSPQNPDPDWTRGVKIGLLSDGRRIVLHVESLRDTPGKVEEAMIRIASQDGRDATIAGFQDPGQAGKVDVYNVRRTLGDYRLVFERPTVDKITAAGPYSARCENGRVLILRGAWNESFLSEHESFAGDGKGHDDQVDAAALADLILSRGQSLVVRVDPDAGFSPRETV